MPFRAAGDHKTAELVVACFSYRLLQLGIGGPLAQAKQRFEALCKSLRDNYEIYVTTNDIALTIMRILDQSFGKGSNNT